MMMPLVPPAEGNTAVASFPTLVHVSVPSLVVSPGVVLNDGTLPPDVPAADVTTWTLLLLSRILLPRA